MSLKLINTAGDSSVTLIDGGPVGSLALQLDTRKIGASNENRNVLMDGEVGRINQSGFDGNWANIADNTFGYDMWRRQDSGHIKQKIEDGNYKPNSVYTLSGNGITTQQDTSPSSGFWNIGAAAYFINAIPNTATNVQLELGTVATEFEILPYSDQLTKVQRYYEVIDVASTGRYPTVGNFQHLLSYRFVDKVSTPTVSLNLNATDISGFVSYQTNNTISIIGNVTTSPGSIGNGTITLNSRI